MLQADTASFPLALVRAPEGAALDRADLARIAELHVASIADSLPGPLGCAFARRMYRFLARSERELVLVERVGGRVESACVLSEDPASLQARLVLATFPALATAATVALLRRAAFRDWLRHRVAETLAGGEGEPGPEITYIFTNPDLRGRGLGARLVERAEAYLRARGAREFWVKTIDDPANRAIAFYEASGFARHGAKREGGRLFVVLHKKLEPR
jgi:ribosomal protein S18 acetylase RimI-like enzyme